MKTRNESFLGRGAGADIKKKIEPFLDFKILEEHCFSTHDLCYFMRGWFKELVLNYKQMKRIEIERYIEDLKVASEFLDKKGYEK